MKNNGVKEITVGPLGILRSIKYVIRASYSRWTSYWSSWLLNLFDSIAHVGLSFFTALFVSNAGTLAPLERYGGDYVAYLVLGTILSNWLHSTYFSPYYALKTAYEEGSLETYAGKPWGLESYIIGNVLWSNIYQGFNITVLFAFGILVLGVHPNSQIDLLTLALLWLITMAVIGGLSLIEASMFGIYEFRFMPTPTSLFMVTCVPVLSGLMFPINLFPEWVQNISALLPHTYIYDAFRLCFTQGASITSPTIQNLIAILGAFAIVLLPTGIFLYKLGIRRAEKEGTLSTWT